MYRSIVVGTDGSDRGEAAVREATRLARGDGARLHVVTAYPDPQMYRERVTSAARREAVDLREVAESVLERAVEEARGEGVEVETHAREGHAAEVIIEVTSEQQADLVVVGDRGLTGIKRFLLGSVASKVAHHAHCSVLLVRGG
jgi:nucleotide-binding universal stress UspA family protein